MNVLSTSCKIIYLMISVWEDGIILQKTMIWLENAFCLDKLSKEYFADPKTQRYLSLSQNSQRRYTLNEENNHFDILRDYNTPLLHIDIILINFSNPIKYTYCYSNNFTKFIIWSPV